MGDATRALDLPCEPLESVPDDPALWAEVPLELLVRYGCVPVRREGERLVLAFGGLDDPLKLDELEFLLERPIEAVVAPAERVAAIAAASPRRRDPARAGERGAAPAARGRRRDGRRSRTKLLPAESPIVRLVDSLVLGAIDRRASDIHIETKDREVRRQVPHRRRAATRRSSRSTRGTTTPSSAGSR